MKLLDDWWEIVKRAWSVRLMLLAGALSGFEVLLAFMTPPDWLPHGAFAAAAGLVTMAAFIARIVAQQDLARREPDWDVGDADGV